MSTFPGSQPDEIEGQLKLVDDPQDPNTVWVAEGLVDFEGFDILGLFRSEAAAESAVAEYKASNARAFDGYAVESYPLLPEPQDPLRNAAPFTGNLGFDGHPDLP